MQHLNFTENLGEVNYYNFFIRDCESILNVVVDLTHLAKVFDLTACSTILYCFKII